MTDRLESRSMRCEQAREVIHRVLDGDLMDAVKRNDLEGHLAACESCREFDADLREVRDQLRSLPVVPLPAAALDEVWRRTSRRPGISRVRHWALDWRAVAAAAVLALAFSGVLRWNPNGSAVAPDHDNLARSEAEARYVLQLVGEALRKTEQAAVQEVLTEQVSPALDTLPIRPRSASPDTRRKSET